MGMDPKSRTEPDFKNCTFPSSMKIAVIKALQKKDCKEDISNYKPLSIVSVVSKIFERSATDQLVKYLEEKGLLTATQHAYRKKHSTTTCLMEAILSWSFSTSGIGKVTRCFHPKTLGPAILFAEKFRLVDLPQDFHHGGIGMAL